MKDLGAITADGMEVGRLRALWISAVPGVERDRAPIERGRIEITGTLTCHVDRKAVEKLAEKLARKAKTKRAFYRQRGRKRRRKP